MPPCRHPSWCSQTPCAPGFPHFLRFALGCLASRKIVGAYRRYDVPQERLRMAAQENLALPSCACPMMPGPSGFTSSSADFRTRSQRMESGFEAAITFTNHQRGKNTDDFFHTFRSLRCRNRGRVGASGLRRRRFRLPCFKHGASKHQRRNNFSAGSRHG